MCSLSWDLVLEPFVDPSASEHAAVLNQIREKRALDDNLKAEMKNVLAEFKGRFTAAQKK